MSKMSHHEPFHLLQFLLQFRFSFLTKDYTLCDKINSIFRKEFNILLRLLLIILDSYYSNNTIFKSYRFTVYGKNVSKNPQMLYCWRLIFIYYVFQQKILSKPQYVIRFFEITYTKTLESKIHKLDFKLYSNVFKFLIPNFISHLPIS